MKGKEKKRQDKKREWMEDISSRPQLEILDWKGKKGFVAIKLPRLAAARYWAVRGFLIPALALALAVVPAKSSSSCYQEVSARGLVCSASATVSKKRWWVM
jgi:hypothetical protein